MRNSEGLSGLWSHRHVADCEDILAAIKIGDDGLDFEDLSWEASKEFAEFWYHFNANKVRKAEKL